MEILRLQNFHLLVIVSLSFLFQSVRCWWLLAMPSAYQMTLDLTQDYKSQCKRMSYLVERQRELCTLSKNMLAIVSKGAQMGLQECKSQFAGRRWNCSTQFDLISKQRANFDHYNVTMPSSIANNKDNSLANKDNLSNNIAVKKTAENSLTDSMQADQQQPPPPLHKQLDQSSSTQPHYGWSINDVGDVFGGILKFNSREKAYVHAISAAGVAYSITRACSQGDLPSCSCDKTVHRKHQSKGRWEWGGCSEDISYGERLSRDFVDSNELVRPWDDPSAKLMNLHNNNAGRRAIRNNMDLTCKCHGVSGSCTVKICWRHMHPFRQIGESLYQKFNGATLVTWSPKVRKLRPALKEVKRHTKRDLVYLQESPDYCEENPKLGVVGTRGRKCQRDHHGMEGCALLCCGRGYKTVVVEQVKDCGCKFVWCCEVKCGKCTEKVEEHYCN